MHHVAEVDEAGDFGLPTHPADEHVVIVSIILNETHAKLRQGRQRVGLAEHRVGRADGKLAHSAGVHHVAEVDEAGDFGLPTHPADEHVVIVSIILNETHAKLRQHGRHVVLEAIQKLLNQRAPRRIVDVREVGPDGARTLQIPNQITMHDGVGEPFQHLVHRPQKTTQAAKEPGRLRVHLRHQPPRQIRHHPHLMAGTVCAFNSRHRLARSSLADPLKRWLRMMRSQISEGFLLQIEPRRILSGIGNLEDELLPRGRFQQEILIEITGQRPHRSRQAVHRFGKAQRIFLRELRRDLFDEGHRWLVVRCSWSVVGCPWLVVRCWLSVVSGQLLIVGCWLLDYRLEDRHFPRLTSKSSRSPVGAAYL